ncbi:MAG: apolipoprotein N-acyltransferase [Nitrospiraceae bacterium]|nr:MAG: apolipoprotein N-acyltransferase [Nitrospiraceae bacterium]
MVKKTDIALAAASGMFLVLSFPLFDYYALAWGALVPLLIAVRGRTIQTSFFLGLLTGFIYFAGTIYWVYHSMFYYGNVPLVFSILLLIVLSLYLALYPAVFAILFTRIGTGLPALLTAPVLWVSLEYLRTYALTGFPWSLLGYSQYQFLPLIQIADITGVYGVSFLVAAVNGAIYDMAFHWPGQVKEQPLALRWPRTMGGVLLASVMALSLLYGAGKLGEPEGGMKIRVSLIQGNIEQDKKWDPRFQKEVMDTYKRLTAGTLAADPDLILWPESALPFVFGYDQERTEEVRAFQKQTGTYLLLGGIIAKKDSGSDLRLSNSAVLLSPVGEILSVYDKIHLVPYGEYVPLKELFPFVGKMVTAIGDFVQGQETTVMDTPFARIGNLICYEIIFPGLVRKFVYNGATVLATVTNDAWFGRTAAPYQHFSMARFRAVENRVPVVRAANTGISGFIDSRGRVIQESGIFTEGAFTEEVTPGSEKSFYALHGDIFAYACIIISLMLLILRGPAR